MDGRGGGGRCRRRFGAHARSVQRKMRAEECGSLSSNNDMLVGLDRLAEGRKLARFAHRRAAGVEGSMSKVD